MKDEQEEKEYFVIITDSFYVNARSEKEAIQEAKVTFDLKRAECKVSLISD